eukprot:GEMP01027885.1.p1 GENE.GEMP01027885.1~~GEMP01027885.1.p1  ORF type:complete len:591 (+),score=106.60 GEMP01027885.1:148-1920(+)
MYLMTMFVLATLIPTIFGRQDRSDNVRPATCDKVEESLNVVFIIDTSSSLDDAAYQNQWETANTLLQGFAEAYDDPSNAIHVGIVIFAPWGTAEVMRPISPGYDTAFSDTTRPRKTATPFKAPIEEATNLLKGYVDAGNTGRNLIVLATDGMPGDCGGQKSITDATVEVEAEKCKSKYPLMALYINNGYAGASFHKIPFHRERIMITLSRCDVLVNSTRWFPYRFGDSSATYANNRPCPYYVSATGANAYQKVKDAAKELTKSTVQTLDPRNTCGEGFHVLNHQCVECPGHPAGDDRCDENTVCILITSKAPPEEPRTEPEDTCGENGECDPGIKEKTTRPESAAEDAPRETTTEIPAGDAPTEVSTGAPPAIPAGTPPEIPAGDAPTGVSTGKPKGAPVTPNAGSSTAPPETLPPSAAGAASAESSDSEESNTMAAILGSAAAVAILTTCLICVFCFVKRNKTSKNTEFAEDEQHRIEPMPGVLNSTSHTESADLRHQPSLENIPDVNVRQVRSKRESHAKRAKRASGSPVEPEADARKSKTRKNNLAEPPSEAKRTSGTNAKPEAGARKSNKQKRNIAEQPSKPRPLE